MYIYNYVCVCALNQIHCINFEKKCICDCYTPKIG